MASGGSAREGDEEVDRGGVGAAATPAPKAKGKGKGKGGPPPPPSGAEAARAAAELQQRRREQVEREKREALEDIANAKELEAKKRDLLARLPTLQSHDVAAVPWDAVCLGVHIAGGKGTEGGGGVDLVELPGGAAICVRNGVSIVTESIADAMAALLGVRVARMRLVQRDCDERHMIKKASSSWSPFAAMATQGMKQYEKFFAAMDPEARARAKASIERTAPCAVLEFVPGTSLDTAGATLEAASRELLQDLGQLCALDLLLNNWDRVPLPCWRNEGNLTNAIVTPTGRLVGIDQQVNHIDAGPGLDSYLGEVGDLSAQVFQGSAPSIVASIRAAIKKHCGAQLSDSSLEQVLHGMGTILRKAVMESREGRLAEVLSAVAATAAELTFDYEGYYGHVTPIEPASVAAKAVTFLQQVAGAVVAAAGDPQAK